MAANLLDRRFKGWAMNRAWTCDITYLATDEGWLYLAAILDLGTRRLVGWSMSERIHTTPGVRRATDGVLATNVGNWTDDLHSDRGVQSASHAYRKLLKEFKMVQSMSRKGNCWDNAAMESFFKTLKVEQTHRVRYETRAHARLDIVNWIEGFYNAKRLHSAIDYRSPADFESSLQAA